MTAVILDGGKPKYDYLSPEKARETAAYFTENLIKALIGSNYIDDVILVTKQATAFQYPGLKVVMTDAEHSLVDNISAALANANKASGRLLFCTSDIPLVGSDLIDQFVDEADGLTADIIYPIIPKETINRFASEAKRTFINLKDGSFTGGNIFLVSRNGLVKTLANIEYIYSVRKSPKKLVKILGILFIVKLLFRRLTVKQLEDKCSNLFSITCKTLISDHAELGIDVDKISDYEFAISKLQ